MNDIRFRLFALALLPLCANAEAEDIRPGLWKIIVESSVPATPGWKPEPFESTQCLTEADAQNPEQLLLGMGGQGVTGCDFVNRRYSAGRLAFELQCAGTLGLSGRGDLGFSATQVNGALEVSFAGMAPGEARTLMQNQLHGVYVGPCPAGQGTPGAMSLPGGVPVPPAR